MRLKIPPNEFYLVHFGVCLVVPYVIPILNCVVWCFMFWCFVKRTLVNLLALPTKQGKDIVFKLIIEYISLRDFGP
jgi:hypothetical protein